MSKLMIEFNENDIPLLSTKTSDEIRKAFQSKFGNFIFRRIVKVYTKEEYFKKAYIVVQVGTGGIKRILFSAPKLLYSNNSRTKIDQYGEVRYWKYHAFTSNCSLRDNDEFDGNQIYLSSENHQDEEELLFGNNPSSPSFEIPPKIGDLVCIKEVKQSKKSIAALKWFICSEQFFRAWTYITHNEHSSFKKEEPKRRAFLMSGNRLNTNSYFKWFLAQRQNNRFIENRMAYAKYWQLRTESVSKKWIHVYSALVLMARYGELPCSRNIPRNRGDCCKMIRWHLPKFGLRKETII